MIFHLLKKKKIAEIRLREIEGFLDRLSSEIASQVGADDFFRLIQTQKEKISDAMAALERAKPPGKDLPPRALHLLEGNRKHFLQEMRLLVESIDPPEDLASAVEFHGALIAKMDAFLRFSQKSYLVCKELLGEETSGVMRCVKELEEKSGSFAKKLEKRHVRNIGQIRSKLAVVHENRQGKSQLEKSMEGILADLSEIKAKEEKVIRTIDKLKKSERFVVYEELQRKRTDVEQKARRAKADFNTLFSEFEKPLKKILPASPEEKRILAYLDNAADALIEDADLVMHGILHSLLEKEFDLPKKREARIKQLISGMGRDAFGKRREQLVQLAEELREVKRSLMQTEHLLGVSEQEGYLDLVRSSSKEIQNKVDALQSKIVKIDESVLIDEINELLLPLGGRIV
jgi:hypothetical protein